MTASGVGGCLAQMIRFPKPAAFTKFASPTLAPLAALLVFCLPTSSPAAVNPSVAVDLAPADALVFLHLPDPVRTTEAWRGTALFKLWNEPEVRAFVERPLARASLPPVVGEALGRLGKVEPREVFAAVVPPAAAGDHPRLVAGFRFDPKRRADLDALLETPKGRLRASFPAGKAEAVEHRGQPLEIFRTGRGDDLLASVTREGGEGWYVVSNDLDLLRAALDRLLDGPKPERPAALGAEADFRAVRGRLPTDVEALTFVRPAAFLKLLPEGAAANLSPGQWTRLASVRAAGMATAFAPGGLIRDAMFALMPDGSAPARGSLDLPALGLGTAADTVFFGSGRLPAGGSPPAGAGGALGAALGGVLAGRGVTPERFAAAFGEEIGAVVQWAENGTPTGTLTLPVKDRATAAEVLNKFVAVPLQESKWERRSLPAAEGGANAPETAAYVLQRDASAKLAPTLALGDRFLFLAASPESARAALVRERQPRALDADSPGRAALAALGATPPDVTFAYLDWRRLFERAYAAARPMLAVSALVVPKLAEVVDVDRLPAAATVSRHLTPATLTQRSTSDGLLLESTGPLPLTQTAGLAVVGLYLGAFAEGFRPPAQGSPEADKIAPEPGANVSPR